MNCDEAQMLNAPAVPSDGRSFSPLLNGFCCGSLSGLGEQWLRNAADCGDTHALRELGGRLIDGRGIPNDAAVGWQLLRKAAQAGNYEAMHELGSRLVDASASDGRTEGETLLRASAQCLPAAMLEFALRRCIGIGVPGSDSEGQAYLRSAVSVGHIPSVVVLAQWLVVGRLAASYPNEGRDHFLSIDSWSPSARANMGIKLCEAALTYRAPRVRQALFDVAAGIISVAFRNGVPRSGTWLAYLIRREETSSDGYPSLNELLSPDLAAADPYAIVNHALRFAMGSQCEMDWDTADRVFDRLASSNGVLEWWHSRAQEGDPEGHLVVAWLVHHGLTTDPDHITVRQRLELSAAGNFALPPWS
jgi:TPR repeat protein